MNEDDATHELELVLVGLACEREQLRVVVEPHGRHARHEVLDRLSRLALPALGVRAPARVVVHVDDARRTPDRRPLAVAARLERGGAKPAVVLPAVDALARADVPDVDLAVVPEREELSPFALPRERLDRPVHLDLAEDLSTARHAARPPVDEVDVPASPRESEDVPSAGREAEPLEGAGPARRGLVGPAEAGVEQAARGAQRLAGLEVVREEEGALAREENGRARGVEGGRGDGQLGNVERLQQRVVGPVDLEEPQAAVGRRREEDLGARVEADLDDRALR